jgi:phage gp37-like protein
VKGHPEEEMHDDDRAMPRFEAPERVVEQFTIREVARQIRRRRHVDRRQVDLDRTPPTTPGEIETRVDEQAMQPGVEPIRIAQSRQISPNADEGVLDRVTRELRVPQNEAGCRVQPHDGDIDELGEGVMIAFPCAFDETSLVHGRLG